MSRLRQDYEDFCKGKLQEFYEVIVRIVPQSADGCTNIYGTGSVSENQLSGKVKDASVVTHELRLIKEELYDLILQTNKISVELCEPGANIREIHNFSVWFFVPDFVSRLSISL
ncbi:hypothetical protein C1H46_040976 [Malus baccata]|uniref:Uncharacterized protein n=1 Tax=Malus baccata TaxID=106549 RepID=A0A540KH13_MALBA|nr:hypothetical protein C1H46_040976 [Malus baccata]